MGVQKCDMGWGPWGLFGPLGRLTLLRSQQEFLIANFTFGCEGMWTSPGCDLGDCPVEVVASTASPEGFSRRQRAKRRIRGTLQGQGPDEECFLSEAPSGPRQKSRFRKAKVQGLTWKAMVVFCEDENRIPSLTSNGPKPQRNLDMRLT